VLSLGSVGTLATLEYLRCLDPFCTGAAIVPLLALRPALAPTGQTDLRSARAQELPLGGKSKRPRSGNEHKLEWGVYLVATQLKTNFALARVFVLVILGPTSLRALALQPQS
jgi:hypothetical protein